MKSSGGSTFKQTSSQRARKGYSILELLIVIAIMAIVFSISIASFLGARYHARERAAQVYAQNVYKVANAYIASGLDHTLIPDPTCEDTYIAGNYDAEAGGTVQTCSVADNGDGTPLVTVTSLNGIVTTLP